MRGCDVRCVLASLTYTVPLLATRGTFDVAVLAGCNVLQLAMFLPAHTSAWMVVCISIERALFSARVHHGDHLSHRATRLVIAGVVLVLLALNFPFLGGLRSVDHRRLWFADGCTGTNTAMEYVITHVYPWIEVSVYLAFPAAIIAACNAVIIVCIRKQRKQVGAITNTTATSAATTQSSSRPHDEPLQLGSMGPQSRSTSHDADPSRHSVKANFRGLHVPLQALVPGSRKPSPNNRGSAPLTSSYHPPQSQVSLGKKRSAQRLTKTCVLVSLTYVLLTVPSYGVFIVYDLVPGASDKQWLELMLKVISFLFSLSNHCINCLLYCFTGSIFRQEVYKRLKKFSCRKD
jgi:hypothetical protein